MPGRALHFREFRLARRGHPLAECQDAAAADPERGRFAVADGAAESSLAAPWARLLVEDFVGAPGPPAGWASGLPRLRQRWAAESGGGADPAALPWYLEGQHRRGAFATFLGLAVEGDRWHALAVGDSCLFQVRAGALVEAFPLARAADFGNAPWLVGSRAPAAEAPAAGALHHEGELSPGDRVWLMTDALAQWFLAEAEKGGTPWDDLDALPAAPDPDAAFAAWVENLRAARRLRNDDVTLLSVVRCP